MLEACGYLCPIRFCVAFVFDADLGAGSQDKMLILVLKPSRCSQDVLTSSMLFKVSRFPFYAKTGFWGGVLAASGSAWEQVPIRKMKDNRS